MRTPLKTPQLNPPDGLLESLDEIEHEQWMHWSKAVAGDVSDATRNQWQRSWVAYDELKEEVKEADRLWARKVVKLLRQRRFFP